MFTIEETIIKDGISNPINQEKFNMLHEAVEYYNQCIKKSDDHWFILFNGSTPFANPIGVK